MAEFQEVMRQLGRICAARISDCDMCELKPYCPSRVFLDVFTKPGRVGHLEEKVMSWAAEHPEPVYPTWENWLTTLGVQSYNELSKPIPADIAEKLGIEPKEG